MKRDMPLGHQLRHHLRHGPMRSRPRYYGAVPAGRGWLTDL